jgi:hypothetical protein
MVLPGGTPGLQLDQALVAERHGWDGIFLWEAGYGVDPWSLLGAMAARTSRIRLGTMLTPLPWRRPWKVASQVVTVDQLSGGRAILGVGIGALAPELPATGEEEGLRERAEMLDEGIELMRTLWRGESNFHGRHYRYSCQSGDLVGGAQPVQQPIPIWVVGVWPRPRSMRRALRCQGVIPQYQLDDRAATPEDLRALRAWLEDEGAPPGFDVIAEGETPAGNPEAAAAQVAPWVDAGATWWLETRWATPGDPAERDRLVTERLEAGPPKEP